MEFIDKVQFLDIIISRQILYYFYSRFITDFMLRNYSKKRGFATASKITSKVACQFKNFTKWEHQ